MTRHLPGLIAAVCAAGVALSARPQSAGFFPVDEVRPGMVGIGRTVFSGNTLEEFRANIVGVLRNSGVMDMIVGAAGWLFAVMGLNTDFVPSLPTALMKSVSGSGARAMALEAMKTYGADSFVGRLVSILQGSSDTTFYIIALYFGAVGITKTRYAVGYGLLADFAAVVAAIGVAYLFFG